MNEQPIACFSYVFPFSCLCFYHFFLISFSLDVTQQHRRCIRNHLHSHRHPCHHLNSTTYPDHLLFLKYTEVSSRMSSSNWEKLFTYDTLVHAIAGSVGSMTAMSVFYPLDTVRSRLQLEEKREAKDTMVMLEELVREEGLSSLYRGLSPVLTSLCCSGFVYFYTFHGLRAVFAAPSAQKAQHSAVKDLALGALAGVVNVYLTTPCWVVNTRMKMQGIKVKEGEKKIKKYPEYKGILDGLIKISQQEGLSTLWAGTVPSLVLVSNPAIQHMVYESLKRRVAELLNTDKLNSGTIFFLGAVSKSISTVITYPLQVIQSKSRYGSDDVKNKRMIDILQEIIAKDGTSGLYKGLESKLLQTVLTTAMMYLAYEKIVAFVFSVLLSGKQIKRH